MTQAIEEVETAGNSDIESEHSMCSDIWRRNLLTMYREEVRSDFGANDWPPARSMAVHNSPEAL